MTSKKIPLSKFATIICLSLIVLGTHLYGSTREIGSLIERNETIVKSTLPNSTKNNPSLEESIVSFGMKLLGTPYVVAGSDKHGFDSY